MLHFGSIELGVQIKMNTVLESWPVNDGPEWAGLVAREDAASPATSIIFVYKKQLCTQEWRWQTKISDAYCRKSIQVNRISSSNFKDRCKVAILYLLFSLYARGYHLETPVGDTADRAFPCIKGMIFGGICVLVVTSRYSFHFRPGACSAGSSCIVARAGILATAT